MAVATCSSSNEGDNEGKVLAVHVNQWKNSWIIDTGASYHMCPHREWFATYMQTKGKVYLTDDGELKIEGIDNVRLRMFSGVVRTVECWHIPKMKRILLSLTIFALNGYKHHCDDGELKLTRGSMVVLKGKIMGKLYILEGSVVEGEACGASSSSDQDASKMWHLRLNHMNEQGLFS